MTFARLVGLTYTALTAATLIGLVLRKVAPSTAVSNANLRIASWWVLCTVTAAAVWLGPAAVFLLFAAFSALALREFSGTLPAGVAVLVAADYGLGWFGYAPAGVLAASVALAFGRTAFWGMAVCVWLAGFAPVVLRVAAPAAFFYLLLIVEASDVFQFLWGRWLGRTPLAPRISPNKTWEGLVGGILSATALGALLHGATPFGPAAAALVSAAMTLAGAGGGLLLSAYKRRRGVKDFGTLIPGHGGVLDRMDSLCFAAPVYYCVIRAFPHPL